MHVYNTATKRVEEFIPREAGKVSLYVCGLTPYDALHLGHARTFLVYDMMRRYLEWRGLQVTHVQHITDLDDKVIARAHALNASPAALAARYTEESLKDCDALGILRAHRYPRVTEHIPEVLALIRRLLDRGYAYVAPSGSVYFRVRAFPRYGRLAGRTMEGGAEAQARIDADPGKMFSADFVLWKPAKTGEPSWESPWGPGRPGWHIECSAMASTHLGPQIDLHGGAIELLFPHHENEAAQTEAAFGVHPTVRYWVHCGVVTVNGRKMAKSVGNVVSVQEALAMAPPNIWRLLVLSSHYRSPLDFRALKRADVREAIDLRLAPARAAWQRIERFLASTRASQCLPSEEEGTAQPLVRTCDATQAPDAADNVANSLARDCDAMHECFITAMDDDLSTPAALTALFGLIGQAHAALPARQQGDARTRHAALGGVRRTVEATLGVLGFAFEPSGEVERLGRGRT